MNRNITPIIFYSNSNIFPQEEYLIRKNECTRYAQSLGLQIVDDDYNHQQWLCQMTGLENQPERGYRCLKCFKFRLLRAAQYAHDNNITVLTTTLASSRWKSIEQINEAGIWAAQQVENVIFWQQNWRKGGLQNRRSEIIKQYNFYNQLYCGCEFSKAAMDNRMRSETCGASLLCGERRVEL